MQIKKMQLEFNDGSKFLIDNNIPQRLQKTFDLWFKHLEHVPVPWRPWDYHFYAKDKNLEFLSAGLRRSADILSISIDSNKLPSQEYINYLHEIFEKNYDGQQDWSDYHEQLHLIENLTDRFFRPIFWINYRHLSGPLNKKFTYDLLEYSTDRISKGMVFIGWDELGKTPTNYFVNGEPNNIQRICELCKPWVTLSPKISFAFADFSDLDFINQSLANNNTSMQNFEVWWDKFHDDWCQHWSIPNWNIKEIISYIPVGYCPDIEGIHDKILQGFRPKFLTR